MCAYTVHLYVWIWEVGRPSFSPLLLYLYTFSRLETCSIEHYSCLCFHSQLYPPHTHRCTHIYSHPHVHTPTYTHTNIETFNRIKWRSVSTQCYWLKTKLPQCQMAFWLNVSFNKRGQLPHLHLELIFVYCHKITLNQIKSKA